MSQLSNCPALLKLSYIFHLSKPIIHPEVRGRGYLTIYTKPVKENVKATQIKKTRIILILQQSCVVP